MLARAWSSQRVGAYALQAAIAEVHARAPSTAGTDWDRFSDSGGYAHLISAAAQYLFYAQHKRDWEIHFGIE